MAKRVTIEQLAAASGVNEKTLRRYKAEGVDITDPDAIRKHGEGLKNPPKSLQSATLNDGKLRKINLECERIALALEIERGKYVLLSDVQSDMVKCANAAKREIQRFVGDMPNMAGLPAAEMSRRGQKWFREICASLHDSSAYSK